ncbi:MAG: pyridoxamine 5'-phosphate oxidase family protein [Peptococcia bacterium]
MELNYQEMERELIDLLNQHNLWVLATSSNDKVTARTMSIVNIGLRILMQTGNNSEKYEQIMQNPQVALCRDNIQIEGVARIIGHPLEERNADFIKLYKAKHDIAYELYSHLEDEVVIEILPSKITLWKYIASKPCRDFIYPQERIAKRIYLNQ